MAEFMVSIAQDGHLITFDCILRHHNQPRRPPTSGTTNANRSRPWTSPATKRNVRPGKSSRATRVAIKSQGGWRFTV